ncbi:MAG: carboxypeptidase regulatory-like domain-containing protein [Thermoprotei archaeon]|nr:carboxypeptidase regulatory-like domain-containing protein [Thermoprotei archaeon]
MRQTKTLVIFLIVVLLMASYASRIKAKEDESGTYRITYTYEGTMISKESFFVMLERDLRDAYNVTVMNTTSLDLEAFIVYGEYKYHVIYNLNVKCVDHFTLEITSDGNASARMLRDVRIMSLNIQISVTGTKEVAPGEPFPIGTGFDVKFSVLHKFAGEDVSYSCRMLRTYKEPYLYAQSEDIKVGWIPTPWGYRPLNEIASTIYLNETVGRTAQVTIYAMNKADVMVHGLPEYAEDYVSANTLVELIVKEAMYTRWGIPEFLYFGFEFTYENRTRVPDKYYILSIYKLHAPSEEIIEEKEEEEEVEREWTIMIYMAADNDLEPWALINLFQIEVTMHDLCLSYNPQTVEDVEKVLKRTAIVVFIDRSPQDYEDMDIVEDLRLERVIEDYFSDWDDSRILELMYNENEWIPFLIAFKETAEWGEVNTGDPSTLMKFLRYATRKYPAPRYMLIIWDHGGGPGGVAFDDTNDDFLTLEEIRQAIEAAGLHMDIICFDTCLMATIEAAHELMNVTDYLVASEEAVPAFGWAYDYWIGQFVKYAKNDTRDLAAMMAQEYIKFYKDLSKAWKEVIPATSSVIDLRPLRSSTARSRIRDFINNVMESETVIEDIRRIRHEGYIQSFGGGLHPISGSDHVDLVDLLLKTREVIGDKADALLGLVNQIIVFNGKYSRLVTGAQGISIYYPLRYDKLHYTSMNTFSYVTKWADLLELLTNVKPELIVKQINGRREVRLYGNYTSNAKYLSALTSLDLDGDEIREIMTYSVVLDEQGEYHLVTSLSKPSVDGIHELLTHELDKGVSPDGEVPFTVIKDIGLDIDADGLEEAIIVYYYMNIPAETLYTSIDMYDYDPEKESLTHYYQVLYNISATAVTIADLNNDNRLELVIGGYKVDFAKATMTDVLCVIDATTLAPISEYEWPRGILLLEAAKTDELIAGNTEWSADSQGNYRPKVSQIDLLSYRKGDFVVVHSVRLEKAYIIDMKVCDIDLDGEQELVLLVQFSNDATKLMIYKLLEKGFVLLSERSISIPANPLYLNVWDVDGDGTMELLFTGIGQEDNVVLDIYSYVSQYGLLHEALYRFKGAYGMPMLTDIDLDLIQDIVLAINVDDNVYLIPCGVRNYVEPRGTLRGRVIDRDGKPVSGAIVMVVLTRGRRIVGSTRTSEGGYFEIRGIPAGTYEVDALWTEYTDDLEEEAMAFKMVKILPRRTSEVVLVEYVFTEDLHELLNIPRITEHAYEPSPRPVAPKPTTIIYGYVRDSAGNPIKGAEVRIDGETAITDENGYYELDLTIESKEYNITVSCEGYSAYERMIYLEAGEKNNINFTLEKASSEETQSRCLIVTAAYGSEMAWPVRFLRSFRDNYVMKTASGAAFLEVFNKFYYSWSPTVAELEWRYPALRSLMRVLLYPLIGSLMVSYGVYHALSFTPELAILIAGIAASLLIGLSYSLPIAWIVCLIKHGLRRPELRQAASMVGLLGTIMLLHLIALSSKYHALLQLTSVSIVLASIALGTVLALVIARSLKALRPGSTSA